MSRFHS
jgi:acetoin utilization deacetylase AcuC-like enzyme